MKSLSECRVLLVDDAKANLDILVEGLKGDHKLSLAMSGELALQAAARTPPDLVLLDIVMPGMDGFEVCQKLRQMPETAEVPIMFLSSLEEVQSKTRGFEIGGNDYLTKPFEMLEVKARVRSLLKAKAYGDAVKEQIASELRIAREIQMGMLPHDFSLLESRYGIKLGAVLEPAREVGGDLYGACDAGPDRLVVFIGDVSGKGLPASMFMVRAISLARLLSREIAEPERILARLNEELAIDNPSGMFVTFLCGVYEPATGRFSMANAGHCRPVLLPAGAEPRWAVKDLGTALGFEPGIAFERTELVLRQGDLLVFYTDGVSEAFNKEQECYGNERLIADLTSFAGKSAGAIPPGLLGKVRSFAAGSPQSDDIAIMSLEASAPAARPIRLELKATPEEVMRAVGELQKYGLRRGWGEKNIFGLSLALEESGSNIVNHALHRDPCQKFQITIGDTGSVIELTLRDAGPEFDPTQPGRAQKADEEMPGGWGLQLVRSHVDEILYERESGENVLRLRKRFAPDTGEK